MPTKFLFFCLLGLFCAKPLWAQESPRRNLIKTELFNYIAGQFPLVYERRITRNFAVEAFGGPTSRNLYQSVVDWFNDLPRAKAQTGYTCGAALKIYTSMSQEETDGFFLGIEGRYKLFRLLRKSELFDKPIEETRRVFDWKMIVGFTSILKGGGVGEMYVGMGWRNLQVSDSFFSSVSGPIRISGLTAINANRFLFVVGFRVGFAF